MDLEEYFEKTEDLGILATADGQGNVDVAIYGRPHVIDEQTVAWIMSDRLSHTNLQSNPRAAARGTALTPPASTSFTSR